MTKETCYSAGTELDGNSKNINMHFPNSLFNNIAGKKTLPLCLPLSGIVVLSMHVFFSNLSSFLLKKETKINLFFLTPEADAH